ncbi:phosphoesterase, MJ0936 family [Halobacteroides halobius DSM 5150]|uniref:Phosphoesterase n=1 Tax=Halobacteroides halobius (strain ATCC 35273 / DSM 5150 / MD-1) TaxID=748449 RepID=L0KC35_HALHC|nr:metallophosphoesterase [Halobacteroides halobius]AGB41929.1 phosphoesterase, MJ0936 family [Halobacteroides halobius DSM 5150]
MKLAVFSDAHGRNENIKEGLKKLPQVDYLLYAGDGVKDLMECEFLSGFEIIAVKGNRDFNAGYPRERIFKVGRKKILLTHGDNYRIKWGIDQLYYRAQELEANIVIFGHTHIRYAQEEQGILFFNPGSISLPRDGEEGSFGLLELEEDRINYKHYNLS